MGITAHAKTETINWYMDGNTYATTQCETGSDIILSQTPYKYGYTFNGWFGYTPIEYLESTGTQWIDTGLVTPNSSTTITTFNGRAAYTSENRNFIVAYADATSAHYCEFFNHKFGVNDLDSGYFSPLLSANTPYDIYMQINGSINTTFGINVSGNNHSYSTTKYQSTKMGHLLLFKLDSDYISKGLRLYKSKIIINNTLVRDFIPVLDPDGVPCVFDKVEGKFYYNAGTGDFIAGPVIWG